MLSVLVQAWGPLDVAPGSYDWITIGRITNPKSLDIDYLKTRIMRYVKNSAYVPHTDIVRLDILRDGKTEMKITLVDFLKKQKEVK